MFSSQTYRLPAEWEPQSGVQLTWPHAGTDWAPMLDEIISTYQQIAREIEKREPLLVVGPPSNDTWARDHAFLTLVATPYADAPRADNTLTTTNNTQAMTDCTQAMTGCTMAINDSTQAQRNQVPAVSDNHMQAVPGNHTPVARLLDFKFNGWGEKFASELDNALNRRLYDEGRVRGEYVDHLDFVLEGGSIESDGRGTIFTTTGCLLAPHRNQPLTKTDIETRLKDYLGARRVLWIDHGQLIGDDTDGHIDTLVRACPNDTLLYMGCDDPHDEQYEELKRMEAQLATFKTLEGRPYRLLKLPSPRPIYDCGGQQGGDGERLPATYANFLVVNGAVLVPTYAQSERDQEAMRIIGEAFPGREVVGIDCRSIIKQHGSLHCCTMQYPEGVLNTESNDG